MGVKIELSVGKLAPAKSDLREIRDLYKQIGQAQATLSQGTSTTRASGGAAQRTPRPDPTFASRLQSAIFSTRVGVGPGGVQVAPLLGRTLKVFESLPGPAGLIAKNLSLGAIAAQAFAREVSASAASMRVSGRAETESGGSQGDIARLRAFGVAPGRAAGASASLRANLSTDPMAMFAAAQLGIGPQARRPFGSQNEAALLVRTLGALRKVTDAEEQLRLARILGVDSMLDELKVSDRVFNARMMDARITEQIYSPEKVQAARDLGAAEDRFAQGWDNLRTVMEAPAWRLGAEALNLAADGMQRLAQFENLGQFAAKFSPAGTPFALGDAFSKALADINNLLHGGSDAAEKHTAAMNRHADALMNYGGGERSESAVPKSRPIYDSRRDAENEGRAFGLWP